MSSYLQQEETRSLAETIGLATTEILALYDEMADLCSGIAAQFPDTYDSIPKYQQAHSALTALDEARTTLDEALERVDPPDRNLPVTTTVGRQTRRNRSMSQRVRLGNVVARLKEVEGELMVADGGLDLVYDLSDIIPELEDVDFPTRHG